jgi:hypothetical protein
MKLRLKLAVFSLVRSYRNGSCATRHADRAHQIATVTRRAEAMAETFLRLPWRLTLVPPAGEPCDLSLIANRGIGIGIAQDDPEINNERAGIEVLTMESSFLE